MTESDDSGRILAELEASGSILVYFEARPYINLNLLGQLI